VALDTPPLALDDEAAADSLATYRVTSRHEIAALLGELRDSGVPVTLSGPDGGSYTTTLWSLDAPGDHAGFGADESHVALQRLVDTGEIVAVAYLDKVKLQFDLRSPILVHGGRACVLQSQLPACIYRFQRRASFRVATGDRRTPTLHLRHPSIPEMRLGLRILDVSVGGCALLLPDDVPPLQAGTQLPRVEVELDAATRFTVDLVLLHVSAVGDVPGQRLGCEWRRLDAAAQRALQRFIDSTQRRQRLLPPA